MSCSPFELKDYFFGELTPAERSAVDQHVGACLSCREELAALNTTRSMLMSVPDEEPPRRIAFVSDKVFEPAWWQKLWASGPRLGFASAAMLAAAILVHGFAARTVETAPTAITAQVPTAATEAEIAKRVQFEVAKAVAAQEQQQLTKTLELINTRLRSVKRQNREELMMMVDYVERVEKKYGQWKRASYE
jgi:anti-sigma factor RsiW